VLTILIKNDDLIIAQLETSFLHNKTYVVYERSTRAGILIDPSIFTPSIVHYVKKEQIRIQKILLTHHHMDHSFNAPLLGRMWQAPVFIHSNADEYIQNHHKACNLQTITDQETFKIGSHTLQVLHTPGHVSEHCCFMLDGHLFTGDTLFIGAVGNLGSETSNYQDLYRSFAKISLLPPSTIICPGHNIRGMGDFGPLAQELQTNVHIKNAYERAHRILQKV
jgi:glyoxylase-like metal-dependent hydrolase (beta-lactamase superfamily II)